MGDWFTMYTLIAFLAGVFLSAMVKNSLAKVKAKV